MPSNNWTAKHKIFGSVLIRGFCFVGVLLILSLSASDCFKLSLTEQQKMRKRLEKRFKHYMTAKMEFDTEAVYEMHSKRYRKRVSRFEFPKKGMPDKTKVDLTIMSYNIDDIEFSKHFTEAIIHYKMDLKMKTALLPMPKPISFTNKAKERWIYVDEDWFREPERVKVNVSGNPFYTDQH
ncbi:hypothetical protein ACFL27_04410 [candidate division CSSED10-310 bacterium]|uniref:Lipoprotein n=1 Tax=candidate division CSSED10-310 bacterium TaxID=2855610 RepID=A0ABV6YTD0_UNCC1